jgi:hypothetical protein
MWNFIKEQYWRVIPFIGVGMVYAVGWVFTNVDAYRLMMCPAVPQFAPEYCGVDIGEPAFAVVPFLFCAAVVMLFARTSVWHLWRWVAGFSLALSIYVLSRVPAQEMWGHEREFDGKALSLTFLAITAMWVIVDHIIFYLNSRKKRR